MATEHGDYENPALFSDEELVSLSRAGDADATSALVTRMIPLVRGKASSIHDSEMGFDDLFQEGMVGLLSAIGSFDSLQDASFKTYAGVCITNRIISAVRKFHGKKKIPSGFCVPLENEDFSLPDVSASPEELVLGNEAAEAIHSAFDKLLSGFEKDVLRLYLDGCSYEETALRLGSCAKSVDNALQRIRRKLKFLI